MFSKSFIDAVIYGYYLSGYPLLLVMSREYGLNLIKMLEQLLSRKFFFWQFYLWMLSRGILVSPFCGCCFSCYCSDPIVGMTKDELKIFLDIISLNCPKLKALEVRPHALPSIFGYIYEIWYKT